MRSIEELEKEIDEIREGCGNKIEENEEFDIDCGEDFENDESESGSSFLLCQGCREKFFKLEAKIQTLKEVLELIEKEIQHRIKINDSEVLPCLEGLKQHITEGERSGN